MSSMAAFAIGLFITGVSVVANVVAYRPLFFTPRDAGIVGRGALTGAALAGLKFPLMALAFYVLVVKQGAPVLPLVGGSLAGVLIGCFFCLSFGAKIS